MHNNSALGDHKFCMLHTLRCFQNNGYALLSLFLFECEARNRAAVKYETDILITQNMHACIDDSFAIYVLPQRKVWEKSLVANRADVV